MARIGLRLGYDSRISPLEFQELAVQADIRGYESLWMTEGAGPDSLTYLTSISMRTKRLKLATGILPIFSRTPMVTAMSAAGLERISQGRFILGLGVGNRHSVEDGHGVPYSRPMGRLRETVEIIQRLLAGERVTHDGQVFQMKDGNIWSAIPSQKVPIYIAALGPQMLELAGAIADGVLLSWTSFNYLKQALHQVHQGATKAGRDPSGVDIAGYVRVAVVDDVTTARYGLKQQLVRYVHSPYYRGFFTDIGFQAEMIAVESALGQGDDDAVSEAISEEMQDQVAIIGNESECLAKLAEMRAIGLQLPVVAPFSTGNIKSDHQRVIEAFAQTDTI